jgi:hypothetical protein
MPDAKVEGVLYLQSQKGLHRVAFILSRRHTAEESRQAFPGQAECDLYGGPTGSWKYPESSRLLPPKPIKGLLASC